MFEYVLFVFNKHKNLTIDTDSYMVQIMKCKDDMKDIRYNIKLIYKTSVLGHTYIINENQPLYACLKEWYIQNYLEVEQLRHDQFCWHVPHVIVFDLDSTLITEEKHVRIRCENVYDSLLTLKSMGCVLILWSYGNSEHVTHSLKTTKLTDFFDTIICRGYKTDNVKAVTASRGKVRQDDKNNLVFVDKSFYLDIDDGDRLPKSPRIILWYLRKLGVNHLKSLTLVDDLKCNDYSYDYFVNVNKCPLPRDDWDIYHEIIVGNIKDYETTFENL
nr:putative 38.0 kDa protein [Ectropis obliqua nucleopolyhedrovirus]